MTEGATKGVQQKLSRFCEFKTKYYRLQRVTTCTRTETPFTYLLPIYKFFLAETSITEEDVFPPDLSYALLSWGTVEYDFYEEKPDNISHWMSHPAFVWFG